MKNEVAIVVPQHRFPLKPDEEISLRHLRRFLGHYDRYLIGPRQLPYGFEDFKFVDFPKSFFVSEHGYNLLLVTQQFYRAFAEYKYMLIYQLDCLVFSDRLRHWCEQNWDYVGAPWLRDCGDDFSPSLWTVGNGGLSLRNVANFLAVLESKRPYEDPAQRAQRTRCFHTSPAVRAIYCKAKAFLLQCGYRNRIGWYLKQLGKDPHFHEDTFWSLNAKRFVTEFRIPPPEEALAFAFECAPRYCFKANNGRLPFGCHAWTKWDRSFWEPFLLK